MLILAADIGGSQARLLLGTCEGAGWREVRRETFRSREFSGIEALLQRFLQPGEQPHAACLAVAGPVRGAQVKMTNLPWILDSAALTERFGFRRLHLMNDFAAQALALPLLGKDDLRTLQPGVPQADGVCALIGAGTGLGMALLAGSAEHPVAMPSEGGHADFAPRDAQQRLLLDYLQPQYGRVSLELLLSGRGLERLYRFVAGLPAGASPSLDAAAITAAARAGDAQAAAAVDLFGRLLTSAAGNLALTALAHGGVFLSGGIAPRILPFLQQPAVRAAFHDKAPMRELLERIPLHVVINEQLGLFGAARMAAKLAQAGE
ncbi:glucokinase [Pseudothauera rhizosphaerae]|uniref:Glucokinase n=1 Tax=Pseudothauera rhizosphaerae TaxID=2565932 RepID=A0A4S4AES0_9RHOO|nr:glucokinase [Pseudothauera rhizosphaerae]THF57241.1 glucokinase [Pseudothauera rhizosphaerae]